VPASAFIALLVVTRAWRRPKARLGILAGSLLVVAFSALALGLSCTRFLALPRVGALEIPRELQRLLDTLFMAWIVPPGMAYATPLLAAALMLSLSRKPTTGRAELGSGSSPV
jgi:hypothetical protein